MNKKITVFTPIYNRGYIVENLYNSLKRQTYSDFEWVVVDDGSTDNTEELIKKFINDDIISIIYFKQKNGGKHRAINKGLDLATGELFFIVDSDDYVTENALDILVTNWDTIKDKDSYCGISGLRGYSQTEIIGDTLQGDFKDCSILEYRYKYRIKGDKAEAFVTKILKENKFPEFQGENFISENIIWNRLGSKYNMRWINEIVYICEYLEDGLSEKITQLRINNIRGTLLNYETNLEYNLPFSYRVRSAVNYYRFLFHSSLPKKDFILRESVFLNIIGAIGGIILNLNDRRLINYN